MESLKFGKFKGQKFNDTPVWYQEWLVKQDWFKMPIEQDSMAIAQKQFSDNAKKIVGWNGHSKKGQVIYDAMFEAEKAMDNAYYNESETWSSRYNGDY